MMRALLFFAAAMGLALSALACNEATAPSCREIDDANLERRLTAMNSGKMVWLDGDSEANEKCVRTALAKTLESGRVLSDSMISATTQITYGEGWTEFEPKVEEFLKSPKASARVASMNGLASSAPKSFEGRLAEFLESESSEVREHAADLATKAGARKHIPRFTELYLTSQSDEQKTYRRALIDLRAGKELADTIAASPGKAPVLIKLMSDASDDSQPALELLRHKDPTVRAAVIPWLGRTPIERSEDRNYPTLQGRYDEETPQSFETDAGVISALALAATDGNDTVRKAAQERIAEFSRFELRQPTLVSLFEAELAKPESKLVAGLCYGIDYSEAGEARLEGLSKSKDKALKGCAKEALKAIKERKRAAETSKR
jgi:hypothetical protein